MTRLQDFLNAPLANVTAGCRGKAGDLFGIELECEGKRVDWDGSAPELLKQWAPHADGSLRAHHGSCQEWVFNGPVSYKASLKRVSALFEYFKKRGSKLVCSNRTSTHVHFNMGDKSAYQLVNLFILFTVLEDILDTYCGEDRNGNLFCLSSRHAQQQLQWMSNACFKSYNFLDLAENWRYCSLNLAALNKFGTVEFRAMRGCETEQEVADWLGIVNDLCQYACYEMRNPVTLIEQISMKTPLGILRDVFKGKNFDNLIRGLPQEYINASVYEGLRLVQMLVYKIGTEFDQVKLKGRDFWASFNENADNPEAEAPAFVDAVAPRDRVRVGGGALGQRAVPFPEEPLEQIVPNEANRIFRNVPPQPFNRFAFDDAVQRERERIRQAQAFLRGAQWDVLPEPNDDPLA